MQTRKRLANGGWLIILAGLLTLALGSQPAASASQAAVSRIGLDAPAVPRQGYRAARGCRGLPGSETTENCRMLA